MFEGRLTAWLALISAGTKNPAAGRPWPSRDTVSTETVWQRRDHIYTVDTETANSDEIFFSKKITWKSRQADVDTCRMKGKHKDECHNFIKVLLQQNDDTLFVCGTNAFNPSCRTYKVG
ncbi:Semaphorin-6A [Ameca splendens]|uniref:Semaphorin-6A n=1 Tax=Ameca splendens TaxID=208324 RepID=A0ABV0YXG9_9TELE